MAEWNLEAISREIGADARILRTILFENGWTFRRDAGRVYVSDAVKALIELSWREKHLPFIAHKQARDVRAMTTTAA